MPQHSFKNILRKYKVTEAEELYIDDINLNLKDLWASRNGKNEKKMNSFICAVFSVLFEYLEKEKDNG